MFITFEGIDGCGKTTQTRLLAEHLKKNAYDVVLTREPGGSQGAEEIRDLLVKGDRGRWSAETEALLFTAARRDHAEAIIIPAVFEHKIVICDRFVDSTRVYQGTPRKGELWDGKKKREFIDKLHRISIALESDITFIIDMDAKIADERTKARQNQEGRFESFGLEFQKALRQGFLNLAKEFPERCRIINGEQSPAQVALDIISILTPILLIHKKLKAAHDRT